MKTVERSVSRFALRSEPWLIAIVGLLFTAAGTWVIVTSDEDWFGGGFVAAGLVILLAFANVETVTFDRGTGKLTKRLRGLVRSRTTERALADITGVRVESSAGGDPSRTYRVVLRMKPGTSEPLISGYSSGLDDKKQLAADIRAFLGLPPEPDTPPPTFTEAVSLLFKPPKQD